MPKYLHTLGAVANAHSICKAVKVHSQSGAEIFLSILKPKSVQNQDSAW